jgi:hypothetical protein
MTSHTGAHAPADPPPRRLQARCPRDRGPLLLEQDRYSTYLTCLTCGYVLEERPPTEDTSVRRSPRFSVVVPAASRAAPGRS